MQLSVNGTLFHSLLCLEPYNDQTDLCSGDNLDSYLSGEMLY